MLELAPGAALAPPAPPARHPEQDVTAIVPAQPKTIRDTGLERQMVLALVAKALHQAGRLHLPLLAAKLRLSINVLREALDALMAEQLAEVACRGDSDIDVQYRLSAPGRAYAADCLLQSRYVGPAPVPLEAFRAVLARERARRALAPRPGAAELAAALADDGLDAALREQIGAALHSGRAILLHGPSGSGKSALARKLGRLLQGVVGVPHALLIGQQIVLFHDPLLHLAPLPQQARQYDERRNCDSRWSVCQRPLVQVGAELTPAMLELRHDARQGVYLAPPHFQASGGLFVIDDLGRQRAGAAELLNRFIGPLDTGADLLATESGQRESVPFDVTLVLATGLAPQALLDEPLLRRIGYKIQLGALAEPAYRLLLRRQCAALRIGYDEQAADYLLERLHRRSGRALLAGYPRELLGHVADFAGAAGAAARLTPAALEQAWASMFACAAPRSPVAAPAQGAVLTGERP